MINIRHFQIQTHTLNSILTMLTFLSVARVAFSATLVESPDVFTGPATSTNSTLIFGQVFTNIGNAYNNDTGVLCARSGVRQMCLSCRTVAIIMHNKTLITLYSCIFLFFAGIFTAPMKGIYHFTFMTFGYNRHSSGAILVKNGQYQISTWEFTGLDVSDTTSNTIILELNSGDTVNIILWQGGKIHTGVFSGFLIFPLYWWG